MLLYGEEEYSENLLKEYKLIFMASFEIEKYWKKYY